MAYIDQLREEEKIKFMSILHVKRQTLRVSKRPEPTVARIPSQNLQRPHPSLPKVPRGYHALAWKEAIEN